MRVAHLLPNLAIGGRERMAVSLCQEGERLGLTSLLVGYDPLPAEAAILPSEVPYWQLDRRQGDFAKQLCRLLHDQKVDIVHAQGHIPACYLLYALNGWQDAPVTVATMHVGLQGTWRWLWQIRRALRRMDQLTAVSPDMARTYARVAGRSVRLLPNGIDLAEFAQNEPQPRRADEPFRFAMLSRLDRIKRHSDAVHAADQAVAAGLHIELHIAGEGECMAALAAMAMTRPWLHLVGTAQDAAAFLRDKHAFLLPSQAEGMPLALAEAMAAGLPAIVSDLPSLHDTAGDAAIFMPVGRVSQLGSAMIALVQDPNRWLLLSASGRNRARAFDLRNVAAQYAELYHSLLRPNSASAPATSP